MGTNRDLLNSLKKDFPEVYQRHEELGKLIHQEAGPLPEKTRWLLKVAISAAARHGRALETHIRKAMAAGASPEEIMHALLLVLQTVGFPTFMEAYQVYKEKCC